ncbi:coenzyme Q-binding protein Coq10p, mitochondrial [Diutina catenulata]
MLCIARRGFFSNPFASTTAVQSKKVAKIIRGNHRDVYSVVSGVDRYNQFIPFVEESFVSKRDQEGVPTEGGLRIGWQDFKEEFVCQLRCQPGEQVIAESLTAALFDQLYTEWNFTPMGKQMTKVELELKYKFKNPLYNTVSSMFSDQVTTIMIKAFEDRVVQTKPAP